MITTLLAVNWLETKACEARLNQRIDELRADMKDNMKELRADMKDNMDDMKDNMKELRADMKELRADNRALGEKLDRVLEALLAVKQA